MEALPPLDVEVVAAQGAAPLSATFRQVNMYGAAVSGESSTVVVNGSSTELGWDRLGYAKLDLESLGQATFQGVTPLGDVHVLPEGWQDLGLGPAILSPVAEPTHAVAVGSDLAVSLGSEVWWVSLGLVSHRVLDGGAPIEGLVARDMNLDGVEDILAWTSDTVFILTGRFGGGMSWGGALQAAGYSVGGVGGGDVSGDAVPDIVIAWAAPSGGVLDVWHGEVSGGYNETPPRDLAVVPVSVSVGDNTGEGTRQVTVLSAEGEWERFWYGGDGPYIPVGPDKPPGVILPAASHLLPAADLTGNGAEEFVVVGPQSVDDPSVYLFDVERGVKVLEIQEGSSFVSLGDGNGDGLPDLWLAKQDGVLRSLHYARSGRSGGLFVPRNAMSLPAPGPALVSPFLPGDVIGDVALLGADLYWWFEGGSVDGEIEGSVFWEIGTSRWESRGDGYFGFLQDVSTESGQVLASLRLGDAGTDLVTLAVNEEGSLDVLGRISAGGNPFSFIEAALCGTDLYLLGDSYVQLFSLEDPYAPYLVASRRSDGTSLSCGQGPDDVSHLVVDQGVPYLHNRSMSPRGAIPAKGVVDAAFAEVDGAPRVVMCSDEGCDIQPWTSATGIVEVVVSTPESLQRLDTAGVSIEDRFGFGRQSYKDLDGDGSAELVTSIAGGSVYPSGTLLTVHRSSADALAYPDVFHLPWSLLPQGVAWLDANDAPGLDLWFLDENGGVYTRTAEVLETTEEIDTEEDTGMLDSGTTDSASDDTGA
jgi:hypothetical protein